MPALCVLCRLKNATKKYYSLINMWYPNTNPKATMIKIQDRYLNASRIESFQPNKDNNNRAVYLRVQGSGELLLWVDDAQKTCDQMQKDINALLGKNGDQDIGRRLDLLEVEIRKINEKLADMFDFLIGKKSFDENKQSDKITALD